MDWQKSDKLKIYKNVAENINQVCDFELEDTVSTQIQIPQTQLIDFLPENADDALFGSTPQRPNNNSTIDQIHKFLNHSTPDNLSLSDFYQDKKNQRAYSRLSKATNLFLTTPATSTPSERLFSQAGWQITDRRNRLSGETTENVMFLYNNMKIKDYTEDEYSLTLNEEEVSL